MEFEDAKQEITDEKSEKAAFIDMLLHGPVFTEEEINTIEENRKSIAAWRNADDITSLTTPA